MHTSEHMQEVFEALPRSKIFQQKGDKVKLGRWASWFNANRAWRGQKMALLLVLLFMGLNKGWWSKMSELPIFSGGRHDLPDDASEGDPEDEPEPGEREPAPAPGPASSSGSRPASSSSSSGAAPSTSSSSRPASSAAREGAATLLPVPLGHSGGPGAQVPSATVTPVAGAAGVEAPRTVKESNDELKRVRSSTKGTLHFVALALANKFGNQVADIVDVATWACCQFFDMGKTVCKTIMGSQVWHVDLALGGFSNVMRQCLTCMEDPVQLQPIGFTPSFMYSLVDEATMEQEMLLAKTLCDLCMAESYTFLLSTMTFSHMAPGKFIGLLSDDKAKVKQCLEELQSWWELLQICEKDALADPWAAAFLKDLMFPIRTYDREIFIMLAEERFKHITPEIQGLVEGYARSWLSTNINEDCMNWYRSRSQAQSAGAFSRMSRWHCATASSIIEAYDRVNVTVTPAADGVAAGTPPAHVFANREEAKFSLPHLESLATENTEYPHMSANALKFRGPAWLALKELKGNFTHLKKAWLSLLFHPGDLIQHIDGNGRRGGVPKQVM